MYLRSSLRIRLAGATLALLLAVLACNFPPSGGVAEPPGELPPEAPPVAEVEPEAPPQESVPTVEAPPEVEPPVPESGPAARIPGLEPGTTLVWWLSTYNLVIDRSGSELELLDFQVPILSPLGMPAEMDAFQGTDTGLSIALTGEASPGMEAPTPGVILISADGRAHHVPAPLSSGALVGAAWSPDSTRIAWLFDVTVVVPNPFDPEACTEAAGCYGRIYDLILTDVSGGDQWTISNHIIKRTNFPHLQLSHWREDSGAIFLKVNAKTPSDLYEDQGGAPLQIDVPSGVVTELDENYLGSEAHVSPDGRWLAWNNDIDDRITVRTRGPNGAACELFFPDTTVGNYKPLAFTLTFSPDSTRLAWLGITLGEDNSADRLDAAAVRIMDLSGCEPVTLVQLEQPLFKDDLPHLTGWLNETLLMVSTHHDTRVLDTVTSEWVEFEWPMLPDPATLVGAVGP